MGYSINGLYLLKPWVPLEKGCIEPQYFGKSNFGIKHEYLKDDDELGVKKSPLSLNIG